MNRKVKKPYEPPRIEIIILSVRDVLSSSGDLYDDVAKDIYGS